MERDTHQIIVILVGINHQKSQSQSNSTVTNEFSYGELIKMGYITSSIFVILIILTFILG